MRDKWGLKNNSVPPDVQAVSSLHVHWPPETQKQRGATTETKTTTQREPEWAGQLHMCACGRVFACSTHEWRTEVAVGKASTKCGIADKVVARGRGCQRGAALEVLDAFCWWQRKHRRLVGGGQQAEKVRRSMEEKRGASYASPGRDTTRHSQPRLPR